jgi:hypothetical protein
MEGDYVSLGRLPDIVVLCCQAGMRPPVMTAAQR